MQSVCRVGFKWPKIFTGYSHQSETTGGSAAAEPNIWIAGVIPRPPHSLTVMGGPNNQSPGMEMGRKISSNGKQPQNPIRILFRAAQILLQSQQDKSQALKDFGPNGSFEKCDKILKSIDLDIPEDPGVLETQSIESDESFQWRCMVRYLVILLALQDFLEKEFWPVEMKDPRLDAKECTSHSMHVYHDIPCIYHMYQMSQMSGIRS